MNDERLYIPYGLIIEKQWWDGCGPKQKPQLIIGGLISLGLAVFISLLIHIIIGLAEDEGIVPKLPEEWWLSVSQQFGYFDEER